MRGTSTQRDARSEPLRAVEPAVAPRQAKQFVVRSELDEPAPIEHGDAVGGANGDDERGANRP